jgi:hypothetical protein
VRQGADEGGQVTSSWLFDPDGTVLEGPQGPVSHLICGGVYDWSTGLIFKGGRYFDPSLGIWLALTPLVVLQSWRGRKRKRRGMPWYVVVVLVMVVGGGLMGCEGGDTATPTCTPTLPPGAPIPPPTPPPPHSLLQHAVRIVLVDEVKVTGPDPTNPSIIITTITRSKMEHSIGTIISGDRVLTHNHFDPGNWSITDYILFTSNTGVETKVEKSKVNDQPKDAGTMVFQLPSGTSLGGTPAPLGDPSTLSVDDTVQTVYYDDGANRMDVLSTKIDRLGPNGGGVLEARLADPSTIIDPGDSGGGMFKGGQLVGNTWSINETTKGVRLPSFRSALLPSGI